MQDKYIKFIFIKRTSSRANKYIGTCSGESDGYYRFQIEILRESFHLIKGKIHAFNYIVNCVGLTVEFLYGICQYNNLKGKWTEIIVSSHFFSWFYYCTKWLSSKPHKLWTEKHSRERLTTFSSGTVLLYNVVSFSLGMQLYKIPLRKRRCNHWKVLVDHYCFLSVFQKNFRFFSNSLHKKIRALIHSGLPGRRLKRTGEMGMLAPEFSPSVVFTWWISASQAKASRVKRV